MAHLNPAAHLRSFDVFEHVKISARTEISLYGAAEDENAHAWI
jgi:hypothetical protein